MVTAGAARVDVLRQVPLAALACLCSCTMETMRIPRQALLWEDAPLVPPTHSGLSPRKWGCLSSALYCWQGSQLTSFRAVGRGGSEGLDCTWGGVNLPRLPSDARFRLGVCECQVWVSPHLTAGETNRSAVFLIRGATKHMEGNEKSCRNTGRSTLLTGNAASSRQIPSFFKLTCKSNFLQIGCFINQFSVSCG